MRKATTSPVARRKILVLSSVALLAVTVASQSTAGDVRLSADPVAKSDRVTQHAAIPRGPQIATLVRAGGTITKNLNSTGQRLGVPPTIMDKTIKLLGLGLDLQRDIKPGDRLEVIYEALLSKANGKIQVGSLLYASLVINGKKLDLYRFQSTNGRVEYLDRGGRSLRSALIRTPVDAARISSRYGMRKHPILGYSRMHRGVDFAAPKGAPVLSAGNGIVEVAERRGGYGNYVRIRHADGIKTIYAHLQSIAGNIKPNKAVRQGQVLGRVGSTGLSSGPHLHHEVHKDGKPIDPALIRLRPDIALTGSALSRFRWRASLLMIRPTLTLDQLSRIGTVH